MEYNTKQANDDLECYTDNYGWQDIIDLARTAIAEIDRLQSAARWVPVSERLPIQDNRYPILFDALGHLILGVEYFYFATQTFRDISTGEICHPKFWYDLPEPPQG